MPRTPRRQTFRRSKGLLRPRLLELQLSQSLSARARDHISAALGGLPELAGDPIRLKALPDLMAYRGQLLSRSSGRGIPIHAASFIRRRQIVLETQLLSQPSALRLIAIHEIFHFVWARLGNPARKEYAALLRAELTFGARGELGESASLKKSLLKKALWRDYVCESFCDTAAWLYAGVKRHPEFTLTRRWRETRRAWFERTFARLHKC